MAQTKEGKTRIVKGRPLAKALTWLGFEYTRDDKGLYIFKRTYEFDLAWRDIHALRSDCHRRRKDYLKKQ